MNFKIMGIVLGAAGLAASIVKAANDHKKWLNTPLVCSPMMEDISNKINEEYKREHNGESPSSEEFFKLFDKECAKLTPLQTIRDARKRGHR